jgi:hypothetical protein
MPASASRRSYPTALVGGVIISDNPELTSLTALANITSVGEGRIAIKDNPMLTSLTGLEWLTSAGEDVAILNLPQVADLEPPRNLASAVGEVAVNDNLTLTSLSGLRGLVSTGALSVKGSLLIRDNPKLESLAHLETLQVVNGDLKVSGNLRLPSLHGLELVTHPLGDVVVFEDPELADLRGLAGVREIGGDVTITGNAQLVDLTGFDNLTSIAGTLTLWRNPALATLVGLGALRSMEELQIKDNPEITDVHAVESAKLSHLRGRINIYGNHKLLDCDARSLADAVKPDGWAGAEMVEDNGGPCP